MRREKESALRALSAYDLRQLVQPIILRKHPILRRGEYEYRNAQKSKAYKGSPRPEGREEPDHGGLIARPKPGCRRLLCGLVDDPLGVHRGRNGTIYQLVRLQPL